MENENGELGRRRKRKKHEQVQEWRSARPRRRRAVGAMHVSGKVRNSPLPLPRDL
jgi:hypothetical protein